MKKKLGLGGLGLLGIVIACSSSPGTGDGGTDGSANDVTTNDSSSNDASTMDVAPTDSSTNETSTDGGTVTLTIRNYDKWCSIVVNGGTPSKQDPQTFTLPVNSTVTASGNSANDANFYWGYWGGVGPDGGLDPGGQDTNPSISFVITANLTLDACCPDNGQPLTQCKF